MKIVLVDDSVLKTNWVYYCTNIFLLGFIFFSPLCGLFKQRGVVKETCLIT